MCHKKAGNEEGTRRARANLKDVHWCVTFVYRKLRLISPTPHCWMLHVASVYTSCCMLLGVVAQTLKPVKLLNQQLPTFLLFHDGESVAQQCWIRLHSSSNIVRATHAHYTWFTSLMVCILPTIHCRSQHRWELLHPLAHHCQHRRNKSQHCWPNNVGSCCVRLYIA